MLTLSATASVRQPLAVNWRNPIARELVVAWTPTQPFTNLATMRAFAFAQANAGDFVVRYNSAGAGYVNTTASNVTKLSSTTDGPNSKTEITVLVQASGVSNGATQSWVQLGQGTAGQGNYVMITIDSNTSPTWFDSWFYSSSYSTVNATVPNPSQSHASVFIATNSVSQSRRENWIDGTIIQTGTAITTGSANNNYVTLFNNSSSGVGNTPSPTNLILIWNRALSVDECVKMSAQPLRLLTAPPIRIGKQWMASGGVVRPVCWAIT